MQQTAAVTSDWVPDLSPPALAGKQLRPSANIWVGVVTSLATARPFSARHARALEYALLRLMTVVPVPGAIRRLRSEEEVDGMLSAIRVDQPDAIASAAVKQYEDQIARALGPRAAQDAVHLLMQRTRDIKYSLAHRYTDRRVMKEAIKALLVLERIRALEMGWEPGGNKDAPVMPVESRQRIPSDCSSRPARRFKERKTPPHPTSLAAGRASVSEIGRGEPGVPQEAVASDITAYQDMLPILVPDLPPEWAEPGAPESAVVAPAAHADARLDLGMPFDDVGDLHFVSRGASESGLGHRRAAPVPVVDLLVPDSAAMELDSDPGGMSSLVRSRSASADASISTRGGALLLEVEVPPLPIEIAQLADARAVKTEIPPPPWESRKGREASVGARSEAGEDSRSLSMAPVRPARGTPGPAALGDPPWEAREGAARTRRSPPKAVPEVAPSRWPRRLIGGLMVVGLGVGALLGTRTLVPEASATRSEELDLNALVQSARSRGEPVESLVLSEPNLVLIVGNGWAKLSAKAQQAIIRRMRRDTVGRVTYTKIAVVSLDGTQISVEANTTGSSGPGSP